MNQLANQAAGGQNTPYVDPNLEKAWNMAQATQNPKEALFNALIKNPKSGPILQLLQKNNWDEQKTFFDYAQQQGIDTNAFLKSLQAVINRK